MNKIALVSSLAFLFVSTACSNPIEDIEDSVTTGSGSGGGSGTVGDADTEDTYTAENCDTDANNIYNYDWLCKSPDVPSQGGSGPGRAETWCAEHMDDVRQCWLSLPQTYQDESDCAAINAGLLEEGSACERLINVEVSF